MPGEPRGNYDPTAGRDARIAAQNRERTSAGDKKDRMQADAAEMARQGQERLKQQQAEQQRHEQFQKGIAEKYNEDRVAQQPNMEASRAEAQARARSVDTGQRDFSAPQAESGMVLEVKDTDWEKNISARPQAEAPKPAPKKPWYQVW